MPPPTRTLLIITSKSGAFPAVIGHHLHHSCLSIYVVPGSGYLVHVQAMTGRGDIRNLRLVQPIGGKCLNQDIWRHLTGWLAILGAPLYIIYKYILKTIQQYSQYNFIKQILKSHIILIGTRGLEVNHAKLDLEFMGSIVVNVYWPK